MGAYASSAMTALQVGSAVVNYVGGNKQAFSQQQAAWDNYYAQKEQLQIQSRQIDSQAAGQMSNRAVLAAVDAARLVNVAADGGVTGLSVDHLIADSKFQASMDNSGIEQNRENQQVQNAMEVQGAWSKAQSQVNQADSKRPSLLSTGLQIGTALGEYSTRGSSSTSSGGGKSSASSPGAGWRSDGMGGWLHPDGSTLTPLGIGSGGWIDNKGRIIGNRNTS